MQFLWFPKNRPHWTQNLLLLYKVKYKHHILFQKKYNMVSSMEENKQKVS